MEDSSSNEPTDPRCSSGCGRGAACARSRIGPSTARCWRASSRARSPRRRARTGSRGASRWCARGRDAREDRRGGARAKTAEMKAIIARGHHAEDFGNYGDFFHEPLAARAGHRGAAVPRVPGSDREPDRVGRRRSGAVLRRASAMQAELCSTSAAIMALLLQAHAEGLGACWMAGPMVAQARDRARCSASHEPWRMVGAIAIGLLRRRRAAARPQADRPGGRLDRRRAPEDEMSEAATAMKDLSNDAIGETVRRIVAEALGRAERGRPARRRS